MRRWTAHGIGVLALLAWAGLADTGFVRHRALAGPVATLRALIASLLDGGLALDVLATFARVAVGVGIGVVLGAPLGFLAGSSPARQRTVEPGLELLRAIPPLLLFPLLLLAFGYDERARVGAVAWAATLVVSMHVAVGAARRHDGRARALRAMGASAWQRLRWLIIPELGPALLAGARHAVATGTVVATVTEMVVGTSHGLGARAVSAQIAYDAPSLYAVIATTGALGWALARLVHRIERRSWWA